jgi:hypothetical protein
MAGNTAVSNNLFLEDKKILTYLRCCQNHPSSIVTYDNGDGSTETLLVCDQHLEEEAFRRDIIKKDPIMSDNVLFQNLMQKTNEGIL